MLSAEQSIYQVTGSCVSALKGGKSNLISKTKLSKCFTIFYALKWYLKLKEVNIAFKLLSSTIKTMATLIPISHTRLRDHLTFKVQDRDLSQIEYTILFDRICKLSPGI